MSLPGLPHTPTFEKFFDFLVPRFWNSLPNNRSALILPGSNRMYISIPAYGKKIQRPSNRKLWGSSRWYCQNLQSPIHRLGPASIAIAA